MWTGRGHHKVILLGEHAVVYGHPALGIALEPGIEVRVRRTPGQMTVTGVHDPAAVTGALLAMARRSGMGPRLAVHVEAGLPAGAGLGGSAALCVAFARALLGARGGAEDLEAVVELASHGEMVFHGSPSGLDAWLSASGKPARYTRGLAPQVIEVGQDLHLAILVDPGRSPTSVMVDKVRKKLEAEPEATRSVFERMEALVIEGAIAMTEGATVRLGEAMTANHALLSRLGVSTPALDELTLVATRAGALGAKLTGGGGGGAVIALAPDAEAAARIVALASFCTQAATTTVIRATREGGGDG